MVGTEDKAKIRLGFAAPSATYRQTSGSRAGNLHTAAGCRGEVCSGSCVRRVAQTEATVGNLGPVIPLPPENSFFPFEP